MNQHKSHLRIMTILLLVATLVILRPDNVRAARRPDPVVAVLMSLGSTLIPIALGTILWTQERGIDEGIRYDLGFLFFGIGGVLGPSTGKFYSDQEWDAWMSLILRSATGAIGLVGCALWLRGEESQTRNNGRALASIGIGSTGALALYDIWTAGSAALETQRQRGYGPATSHLFDAEKKSYAVNMAAYSSQKTIEDLPLSWTRLQRPQFLLQGLVTRSPSFFGPEPSLSSLLAQRY